ncbi:hypothetical protein RIR_jg32471.t1 [Rhizophagus irregularis DAOM 181602=DAOM 197198]|nr:hypothetical protein RIR_jg32471.t1 [Rhizophagus irregularis DAOM 181602=DAOM 197198]
MYFLNSLIAIENRNDDIDNLIRKCQSVAEWISYDSADRSWFEEAESLFYMQQMDEYRSIFLGSFDLKVL